MNLAGALLERAARATPATEEDRTSGWWIRHTDGNDWWSGAVLAHDDGRFIERIERAERFYAERHAVARFQICPGCPPGLDDVLAARGYRWAAPVSLLIREAGPLDARPAAGLDVRLRAELTSAYVTVSADRGPVAIGRAVADDGWTGVFGMATAPGARRRGAARLVLAAIAGWARRQDAPRLYLQVEQSNAAARRVYAAAGFTELATYHYRFGLA